MNEQHRKLALDMALEGKSEKYITQNMATMHGLSAAAARECAAYAVRGDAPVMEATRGKNQNNRRARKAASILIQFYDKADLSTSCADLLADMMHLAARSRTGFSFEEALERASNYFAEEREGL